MKDYKTNEDLINYLSSKRSDSYKSIFKEPNGNYISNVSFDEIYALFEFDKNLRNIILKYCLEIETVIK